MTASQKSPYASATNLKVILWTTLIGGFFSSLVKWGSEVNMPPRAPGEISPPGANIDAWLGWLGLITIRWIICFKATAYWVR